MVVSINEFIWKWNSTNNNKNTNKDSYNDKLFTNNEKKKKNKKVSDSMNSDELTRSFRM